MNKNEFFQRLQAHAETGATISDDRNSIGYDELLQRVENLSYWLQQQHIQRLGLLADNSLAWLLVDLAALHAGITLVPVPPFFTKEQQQQLLEHAMVNHLFSDQPALDAGWQAQTIDTQLSLQLYCQNGPSAAADSCKITYTSGSTAAPKGVRLNEQVLFNTVAAIDQVLPLTIARRHLCIMPLAVLLENIAGVWLALWRGMTIHLPSPLSIGLQGSSQLNLAQFWQALTNYAADSLITTPALAAAVLQGVASGVLNACQFGFIAVGGAAVPAQLLSQAAAVGLPIYQGYGLSECGSVVTLNTPAANRPGTVGKALPGLTLHLHDGELFVSGKAMDGYLGTEAPPSIIATGDLASCDDDGFITIYGRKSNLLITSFGRNISPEWPENLAAHSAYWSQFMVCGDGYPGLVALLTPTAEGSSVAIDEAIKQLNQQLPDYAQITAWIATNEPFSQENQQLTFNNRFRRGHIVAAYRNQIDAIFGG